MHIQEWFTHGHFIVITNDQTRYVSIVHFDFYADYSVISPWFFRCVLICNDDCMCEKIPVISTDTFWSYLTNLAEDPLLEYHSICVSYFEYDCVWTQTLKNMRLKLLIWFTSNHIQINLAFQTIILKVRYCTLLLHVRE